MSFQKKKNKVNKKTCQREKKISWVTICNIAIGNPCRI